MKNLLLGLIATVFFSAAGKAQVSNKPAVICYTLSCCSYGPFGIEVWSERTCYTITKTAVTVTFNGTVKDQFIEIAEDRLLLVKNDTGENLIIPKGRYQIVNGELSFPPVVSKPTVHCITVDITGEIFGHPYSSHDTYCWTWGKNSNLGNLEIKMLLNDNDKKLLLNGNTTFTLSKDILIKDNEVNYTMKAGKYVVNPDGNIYLQGVKVK